jgi:TRAP-type uncharacterized transport system fused permease subunit
MDSGLGVRFSNVVIAQGGGHLWLALIMTMVASIILGMGLLTTAVYITLAVLVIPALVKLGAVPIAAHMFAFYFGVFSAVTPPVALAAFAAAGVAGSNPMQTGWIALRLSITAFIVPFMFVYNPELLFIGSWHNILLGFITGLIGVTMLGSSTVGFLLRRMSLFERAILFFSALILMKPGIVSDLVGLAGFGVVFVIQKAFPRRKPALGKV